MPNDQSVSAHTSPESHAPKRATHLPVPAWQRRRVPTERQPLAPLNDRRAPRVEQHSATRRVVHAELRAARDASVSARCCPAERGKDTASGMRLTWCAPSAITHASHPCTRALAPASRGRSTTHRRRSVRYSALKVPRDPPAVGARRSTRQEERDERARAPPEGEEVGGEGRDEAVRCVEEWEERVMAVGGTGEAIGRDAGSDGAEVRAAGWRALLAEVDALAEGAPRLKLNLLLGAAAAMDATSSSCSAVSSCSRDKRMHSDQSARR